MSNAAFVAVAVVLGYAIIWGIRNRLGSWRAAVVSYPLGLVGIVLIAMVHAALNLPWSPVSFGLIAAVVAGAGWAALRAIPVRRPAPRTRDRKTARAAAARAQAAPADAAPADNVPADTTPADSVAAEIESAEIVAESPAPVTADVRPADMPADVRPAGMRADAGPAQPRPAFRAWTAAVTVAVATVVAALFASAEKFYVTADSWANYEPMGMRLHDTGRLFERLMEERSPLVPAMHAAHRVLGGDFLFAAYPLLGLWLLFTVFTAVSRHSVKQPAAVRYLAASVAVLGLGTSAVFVLQSLYIHSHMVSALFITLALLAFSEMREGDAPEWATIGGLAVAAFALARPDGLSYAAILLFIGLAASGATRGWRRNSLALMGGFWVPTAITYAIAFAQLGLWKTAKLSGQIAALSLGGLVVLCAVAYLFFHFTGSRRVVLASVVAPVVVVMVTAAVAITAYLIPDRFVAVLTPMIGNLFDQGGYGPLWYIALVILIAAASLPWLRHGTDTRWIPFAGLVLFMETALVIHGTTHPGHLGWTDSFNRIAFHAAPLVWWIFGGLFASALRELVSPVTHKQPAAEQLTLDIDTATEC